METYSSSAEVISENTTHGPSRDFIHAVSEFLDTDPTDLLVELGYYDMSSLPSEAPIATADQN